jgi:hypothetical protein
MATNKAKNKTAKSAGKSKATAKKSSSSASGANLDRALREQLGELLKGAWAHADFDAAVGDWPVQLAGVKVANFPHTAWMLLEHMRIGQWDILEFSRNPKHKSPKWPDEYWPKEEAPANEKEWKASVAAFKKDLQAMKALAQNPRVDLFARIPWGDGQTVLREILLVADHSSYHLGQLVMMRKSIGI